MCILVFSRDGMADGRTFVAAERKLTKSLDNTTSSPVKSPEKKTQGKEGLKSDIKKDNLKGKDKITEEMDKLAQFEERIMNKMETMLEKTIKGTLDSAVRQTISDMEQRIFTKISVLIKKEVEDVTKKERKLLMKELETIKEKCNHNEQYSRKASVRIHGKEEAERENTEHVAIGFLKDALGLEVNQDDIDIVHRTGVRREGKGRQILAKFKSHKTKVKVFKVKKVNRDKSMKEHKMNITEDLTTEAYRKHREIRGLENVEKAWTIDGKINVKIRGESKPRYNVSSAKSFREDADEEIME